MYTFRDLRKAAKLNINEQNAGNQNTPSFKLAILGNCATQFLATSVEGYAKLESINIDVFDADFNQIDMQLLDQNSETYSFGPDAILLWLSTDKLYEEFLDMSLDMRSSFAIETMDRLERYWDLIRQNIHCRILQPNFTEIDDKSLGNYSAKAPNTFSYQIRKLNFLLQEKLSIRNDVYPLDFLSVQIQLGQKEYYDAALYYNAKVPVALNAFPYVAKTVIDVIKSMLGRLKKCIILDLDNTLWGGVIGDDGMKGIEIGELGRGHAYSDLQRWLKQLKECGIILAVCSKNDEKTAKEPFENHEEMILRLEDISVFVANWDDKASNIKLIQQTLNIGMDSIVFIDDNPFERNLVKELIPDIEVPELPEDPALYLSFLQSQNYFDTVSFTGAGQNRTKQYQAEYERKKLEKTFESIDDYLQSLEMIATAKPFEPVRYARIAQLTQRSNQFNLRTIRYTEDEIQKIAEDDQYLTLYYTLKDKFGDHGLVSVVILKKLSSTELFVDTWLMSCRVLKRGMEEFIVDKFIKVASDHGYTTLKAEYIPTAKNSMVKNIYSAMGFDTLSENQYEVNLSQYEPHRTYIMEEKS